MQEMQEMQVRSLGWEDSLEKGMATHSSVLGLENSTDRGAWPATVHRIAESDTNESLVHTHTHIIDILVSVENS